MQPWRRIKREGTSQKGPWVQAEEDGEKRKQRKEPRWQPVSTPEGKRRESSETEGLSVSDFVFGQEAPASITFSPWPYDLHCKWSRECDGAQKMVLDRAWASPPICMLQGKRPRFLCVFSRQPSPSTSNSHWKIRKDMSPAFVLPTRYHLAILQDFMTNSNE